MLLALVGNIFVILTIMRTKDKKIKSNYFMINLAFSDILLGKSQIFNLCTNQPQQKNFLIIPNSFCLNLLTNYLLKL